MHFEVSHADYVLTWGPGQRRSTVYTPNLSTDFGLGDDDQPVRLPTTTWPLDHAGVTTTLMLNGACSRSVTACSRHLERTFSGVLRPFRMLLALAGLFVAVRPIILYLRPATYCIWSDPEATLRAARACTACPLNSQRPPRCAHAPWWVGHARPNRIPRGETPFSLHDPCMSCRSDLSLHNHLLSVP